VRLDHLLSKEHHEKHSNWWGVSREEPGVCSGYGLGAQQQSSFYVSKAAGTLLGPETTPGPVGWVGVVAPSWWWGVVFGNWIVVASIEADALPWWVVCLFCAILIF
jgi:hypothetical protein